MEQPETLLACPFCGGEGEYDEASGTRWVECLQCAAAGPVNEIGGAAAIKAWNVRAGAGRASQDNGGKQLCSSAWLDALVERWERREAGYEYDPMDPVLSAHREACAFELRQCIKELRAEVERAANRVLNEPGSDK